MDEHGLEVQADQLRDAVHISTAGEEGDLHGKESTAAANKWPGRSMKAMWAKALDINNLRKLKRIPTDGEVKDKYRGPRTRKRTLDAQYEQDF